jgi:hypothetical protein
MKSSPLAQFADGGRSRGVTPVATPAKIIPIRRQPRVRFSEPVTLYVAVTSPVMWGMSDDGGVVVRQDGVWTAHGITPEGAAGLEQREKAAREEYEKKYAEQQRVKSQLRPLKGNSSVLAGVVGGRHVLFVEDKFIVAPAKNWAELLARGGAEPYVAAFVLAQFEGAFKEKEMSEWLKKRAKKK